MRRSKRRHPRGRLLTTAFIVMLGAMWALGRATRLSMEWEWGDLRDHEW